MHDVTRLENLGIPAVAVATHEFMIAARAQAAFEGRTKINDHDIALAAELALPHRIKRTPFQQAEMTTEQLQERIEQLAGQSVPTEAEEESESQQSKAEEKKT